MEAIPVDQSNASMYIYSIGHKPCSRLCFCSVSVSLSNLIAFTGVIFHINRGCFNSITLGEFPVTEAQTMYMNYLGVLYAQCLQLRPETPTTSSLINMNIIFYSYIIMCGCHYQLFRVHAFGIGCRFSIMTTNNQNIEKRYIFLSYRSVMHPTTEKDLIVSATIIF